MFHDNDLRLAAICDPRFKFKWLQDSDQSVCEKLLKDVYNNEKESDNLTENE